MAAIARFIRLRRVPQPYLFSTSSANPPGPETEPERQSSSSSHFEDVKSYLQRDYPSDVRRQTQRPLSFSNPAPSQSPPSKIASFQEINKNLSEFRRRSAVPPPSSPAASVQSFSFLDIYEKNLSSQADGSNSIHQSKYPPTAAGSKVTIDSIRSRLRGLRNSIASQNHPSGKPMDPMSLAKFKESFKLKPGDTNASQLIIGGSDSLTPSYFGKDKKDFGGNDNKASTARTMEFVRPYSCEEMGKRLDSLRPEKKGKWFSLQELNDRLVKMRQLEAKEIEARGVPYYKEIRESLVSISSSPKEQAKKEIYKYDVLSSLGGTPSFMLSPPKEHLVEKFFHPDHMSSAEKLKLELQNVRDEYKMSESDCGSARVQVAQLTTKIKHLSTVLHKKDKHSRKGLQEMVHRRKKLLKYLRRTDWDSYALVLSKLGLRDNPDLKA